MSFSNKTILVTGAAGFIGFYLCRELLRQGKKGVKIVGFDNMNSYYDVSLKEERLRILRDTAEREDTGSFLFVKGSLQDAEAVNAIFWEYKPDIVVNLAAQAGVRYSVTNPKVYIETNLVGFFNMLEACRHSYDGGKKGVEHFVYASSSSVYGSNTKVPYSVKDKADCPSSLYAATKKADELLAYTYSSLYHIPVTGLRFFTVYGPLGRPDMAYFGFTNKLVKGEKIQLFNYGDMYRDFTYIDDIITGMLKVLERVPTENEGGVRSKLYNIGGSHPKSLISFVRILEKSLMTEGIIDKPAEIELLPMQAGDVYQTYADTSELEQDFGFKPEIGLEEGLGRYARWYREYYIKETDR